MKKGDILCAVWHYTQTIPDFYEVLQNTGKTVLVKEIGKKVVSSDGYGQCGWMVADRTESGREIRKRINKFGEIRIGGARADVWNGQPVYFDYYD